MASSSPIEDVTNLTNVPSRVRKHRSAAGVAFAFYNSQSSDESPEGSSENVAKFNAENIGQQALEAKERELVDVRKPYEGDVRKKRTAEEKTGKMEVKKTKREAVAADLAKECCKQGCLG